jgi:hypothetical protein
MSCPEGPLEPNVIEQASRSVEADVVEGFAGMVTSRGFSPELHESGLDANDALATSDHLVVVPWVYRCTHTGDFLGVPPTYIELELRGTTFVHACAASRDGWEYYRYIDFIGALQQLGVATTSRPALSGDEFDNWDRNRQDRPQPPVGEGAAPG